jgi:hypothetical protein
MTVSNVDPRRHVEVCQTKSRPSRKTASSLTITARPLPDQLDLLLQLQPRISIRLPLILTNRLDARASKERIRRSSLVRALIESGLDTMDTVEQIVKTKSDQA